MVPNEMGQNLTRIAVRRKFTKLCFFATTLKPKYLGTCGFNNFNYNCFPLYMVKYFTKTFGGVFFGISWFYQKNLHKSEKMVWRNKLHYLMASFI